MFNIVREEQQLTYDASFQLHGTDTVQGGWYQVFVTSSPEKVQQAVRACKEALGSLRTAYGVSHEQLEGCKRSVIHRIRSESSTIRFWLDRMNGIQRKDMPLKSLFTVEDYESLVNSLTVDDLKLVIQLFNMQEDNMTVCVGIASPMNSDSSHSTSHSSGDDHIHPGGGRGHVLGPLHGE